VFPVTQMGSMAPGYSQHVVPVPHAAHGHVVQDDEAKKSAHVPCAQTWSVAHATPQLPGTAEQWSGLSASCTAV
jgi:hypothetical protein